MDEDAGHEEIKNTEDEGDHRGEEGHAHQHTHQAQASDKQQEPWRRQATGGWLPSAGGGQARGRNGEAAAPTLEENKADCRDDEGHDGKGEEESNGQNGESSEQQQSLSHGGVAEEVLTGPGAQQLRNLLMRHKADIFDSTVLQDQTPKGLFGVV